MRVTMKSVIKSIVKGTLDLPDGKLRQAVLRELYDQLAAVMKTLALVTAINGIAVTAIFWQFTEWWMALVWVAPILFFSYYQYVGAVAMSSRPLTKDLRGGFLKKGARNNFLFGAWWAASCLIFAGPDQAANITLAALSMGMCAAAAACLGSNAAMSARFLAGALPVTIFSLLFIDGAAAIITCAMGGTLGITMVYMAHMKYHETVEMLRVRLGLELSKDRLESAVKTLGIGLEIKDSDGETVFCNSTMTESRDAISNGNRNRDGFYFWSGKYYRHTMFDGAHGDHIDLVEDVSPIVETQHEILQSRKQAEEALQTKSAFFESISREVMYPIASIMKYARLLLPDSRVSFDEKELGNLASLITDASRDLESLISSITRHSLEDNAYLAEAKTMRLRDIFREELNAMAGTHLDELTLKRLAESIPEELMVKASASGSLTRALGQMCLKAVRSVGLDGKLALFVRQMGDTNSSVCFIVRGSKADDAVENESDALKNSVQENWATLDEYASYMSETHIANLGGQYREDLSDKKTVNLVAVVPGHHVFGHSEALKTIPRLKAAH